jgi:putative Mg2+ transporter-C (MgtC) family protein
MDELIWKGPLLEILERLLVAVLLGALVGLNRELHDKPTGLRTHSLVALGAALAVVLVVPAGPGPHSLDTLGRVIQGVVTGVGFLGAGVILRDPGDQRVHGLNTAAAIWLTAMIGIACGAGQFMVVSVASILALVVLALGAPLERLIHRQRDKLRSAAGHDPSGPGASS